MCRGGRPPKYRHIFGKLAYYTPSRTHAQLQDAQVGLDRITGYYEGNGPVKRISMAELASTFEDGEVVFLAGSCGEPIELSTLLADPAARVADAHFVTPFVPGINGRCLARPGRRSRLTVFFMQPSLGAAASEGRVDFKPLSYSAIQRHLSDPATRIDTVVVQMAPPDPAGRCSLGPAVEFMPTVIARAARVIGILNPRVAALPGSVTLPIESFDCVAHSNAPLATYDAGRSAQAAGALASHVARLIPDGATVQTGLGKLPSQLLHALGGHRRLRLHTGMISDAVLHLAQSGALSEESPIMTCVAVGGADFYGRLSGLPGLAFAEVAHTHAAQTLAGLASFHAVNSAVEVDLFGRVNAESIDGRRVSGPGGLPDFAHAASQNSDGLSIIALPATDGSGTVSRIVPRFHADTPITVPGQDVDAVVTEFGAAMLRGQPPEERARRLCEVAHPDHRAKLREAARIPPESP